LTIAGSDSGGGAGIQADLKTFAALGVHGMSAVTSITAQNTVEVTAFQDIKPEVIRAQIEAVAEDIGVDAAKTGMLHTAEIIEAVAEEVEKYRFPTVVDPVMVAKSGSRLLEPEAVETLIEDFLPLATVLTPNAEEAEAISGVRVKSVEEAKKAAEEIFELGPEAVVVKGGHIPLEGRVLDVLFYNNRFHTFEAERFDVKTTHGTGCSFSSAIAAELAKGRNIVEAVGKAQDFVVRGVKFGLAIGRGHGPVNPMADLYNEAERYSIVKNVGEAVEMLEDSPDVAVLIPEVTSNLVMALPYANDVLDVCGIPGRIVKLRGRVKASSCPRFGASRHVANTVLTAMKHDPDFRAGINLKYSKKILEACEEMGLTMSFYDRGEEPPEVKGVEGMSTKWGAETAIERIGKVPNIIYHTGDWGKEPMITILGRSAVEVADTVTRIAEISRE